MSDHYLDLVNEAARDRVYDDRDWQAATDPSCDRPYCRAMLLARTGDTECAAGHVQPKLVPVRRAI